MASQPTIETVSESPTITFTQFVLPRGDRRYVSIEVAPDVASKADTIVARGFRFECELLRTGQVSLTITDPEEGDADIRVVPNGPGVRDAVEDLVRRFGEAA
jgi:hypothetical protein